VEFGGVVDILPANPEETCPWLAVDAGVGVGERGASGATGVGVGAAAGDMAAVVGKDEDEDGDDDTGGAAADTDAGPSANGNGNANPKALRSTLYGDAGWTILAELDAVSGLGRDLADGVRREMVGGLGREVECAGAGTEDSDGEIGCGVSGGGSDDSKAEQEDMIGTRGVSKSNVLFLLGLFSSSATAMATATRSTPAAVAMLLYKLRRRGFSRGNKSFATRRITVQLDKYNTQTDLHVHVSQTHPHSSWSFYVPVATATAHVAVARNGGIPSWTYPVCRAWSQPIFLCPRL